MVYGRSVNTLTKYTRGFKPRRRHTSLFPQAHMASSVSAVFLPHSMKVHMHKHWVSRVLISRSITRLRTESSGGKNFPMHSCLCVHVRNEGVTCVQHVPARLRPEFPGGIPIRIIYGFTCGIKVSRVYPSHGFAWLRRMYAGGISFCM